MSTVTTEITKFGDYRDVLRPRGIQPLTIERTVKREGDHVLKGNTFERVGRQ